MRVQGPRRALPTGLQAPGRAGLRCELRSAPKTCHFAAPQFQFGPVLLDPGVQEQGAEPCTLTSVF